MRRGLKPSDLGDLFDQPRIGTIARLEPDVMTCWDYADDFMMPPTTA